MKIVSSLATCALLLAGVIACNNGPESQTLENDTPSNPQPVQPRPDNGVWFTLDGFGAEALHEALSVRGVDGVKKVSGKAHLSCRQQIPNIPDGAQGLFFPTASCHAYPEVDFPDGAQGLVAPWFELNGMQGYELFRAMPVAVRDDVKTYSGDLTISCELGEQALCSFSKSASEPEPESKITLEGRAAEDMYDQIGGQGRVRQLQGEASLSCQLQTGEIPDGAQGIVAPMAYCVAYPHVNFPAGALGIVRPWFILQGLNGYQLYRAMPVQADGDRAKSIRGELRVECQKRARTTKCTIDY